MLEAGIIQYTNALGVLMGLILGRPGNHGNTEAIAGIHRDNRHRHSRKPATTPAGHPGAERLVNARAASLGASKSDWWPKVFVKGSVGFASHDLDKLVNHNSLTYEIAPAISWNFFQGTKLAQVTRLAKASSTSRSDNSTRMY